jgi:hypothetical protein
MAAVAIAVSLVATACGGGAGTPYRIGALLALTGLYGGRPAQVVQGRETRLSIPTPGGSPGPARAPRPARDAGACHLPRPDSYHVLSGAVAARLLLLAAHSFRYGFETITSGLE